MAGRRRGPAAASAIHLASELFLHHRQEQRERRRRAEDIFLKLQLERQRDEHRRTEARAQLNQGALSGTDLVPSGFTDPVTGVKFTRPSATGADPSLMASRLSNLYKDIGAFEARNAEEQAQARPASRGVFGIGARPAYTPSIQDTSALRQAASEIESRLRGGTPSALGMDQSEPRGGLPDPSEYMEGDVIQDDQTGDTFELVGGQWVRR